MTMHNTSAEMRKKIEGWEGKRNDAYQDAVGEWTIGYGHTGDDVASGVSWTDAECDQALTDDLETFEGKVNNICGEATQNQFDALVSFAYNLGFGNLKFSILLKKHLAGDYAGAAAEFPRWCHAEGKVLPGLVRRREGEQAVYADGDYSVGD